MAAEIKYGNKFKEFIMILHSQMPLNYRNSYGRLLMADATIPLVSSNPTEKQIYSDIHNNPERVSDYIAEKILANFTKSLREQGLLKTDKLIDS